MSDCLKNALLVLCLLIICKSIYKNTFDSNGSSLPKIIHQQGYEDVSTWPEMWTQCRGTWLKHFPESEYRHMLWNESSKIDFIRVHYPWALESYMRLPKEIMRCDVARLLILHKYGGIYGDLDYQVNRNFYDQLPSDKISIIESKSEMDGGTQNSLIASPPNKQIWIELVTAMFNNPKTYLVTSESPKWDIINTTGPKIISTFLKNASEMIHILPMRDYQHHRKGKSFGTHKYSSVWVGKDEKVKFGVKI